MSGTARTDITLSNLGGLSVYFVGIKGTGMAALAELFHKRGAKVAGSDVPEKFYTDRVLHRLGIPYQEGFRKENIPPDAQVVIYSAAYDPAHHPELRAAAERGLPLLVYTEALALLSRNVFSVGIAGVHGKTTTTALIAATVKALGLPGSVLVGSAAADLDYQSTLVQGERFFAAETCEYRRHFLSFSPDILVVTSIEEDHLDYYSGLADIKRAFLEYAHNLPPDGTLIYCVDDPGARELAETVAGEREASEGVKQGEGISLIPYGFRAIGPYAVTSCKTEPGRTLFSLGGFEGEFTLKIPGTHTVENAAAAIAVCSLLIEREREETGGYSDSRRLIAEGIAGFSGSRRRSEIIGEAEGVLFLDDYGHHPTAIRSTLEGLKRFYPDRRIVVDFMSHTYSRTAALFDEFARAFDAADEVILHKIYSSAREQDNKAICGHDLFLAVKRNHPRVRYFEEVMDAKPYCRKSLGRGDLFITMGAGDNWTLGHALYNELAEHDLTENNGQRLQA